MKCGMQLTLKRYDELTRDELYAVLRLRSEVFVVEQRSIYLDPDGQDEHALHLLVTDGGGRLCACLRIVPEPGGAAHIGRVVVRPDCRGKGLGRAMLRLAIENAGSGEIALSAQAHLRAFYESFGFHAVSQPYDDGGVLHIDMVRLHT